MKREDIESFLYREAALLDAWKLEDWLQLFTEDCVYWIPCNEDDNDPTQHISIAYDDRKNLQERIWRLNSGKAYSQEPRSRTRRLISNVEILNDSGSEITVSSSFALFQTRLGRQNTFAGRYEHRLRKLDGGWKIAFKKIELINNNDTIDDMTFMM
jgi:benzoate/toluate 1,2-dioxygenase beta subunit